MEILFIDSYTLAYGTPSAKERYLTLMEENPELLQYVSVKTFSIVFIYYITIFEQNTGRAEEKEINHPNTSIPFSESMLHNLSATYLLRYLLRTKPIPILWRWYGADTEAVRR